MVHWIVTDTRQNLALIGRELVGRADVSLFLLDEVQGGAIETASAGYVDVDLSDPDRVRALKRILPPNPHGLPRLFACDLRARTQTMQATALGASQVIFRPAPLRDVLALLDAGTADRSAAPVRSSAPGVATPPRPETPVEATTRLAGESAAILGKGMDAVLRDGPFDTPEFRKGALSMVRSIGEVRLGLWLGVVRDHHEGTYRHVLTVAGIAARFADLLRIDEEIATRITLAALVHDVGKARIPNMILEKPTTLTREERAIIERHPDEGADFLLRNSDLDPEVLFAVRHHHEMLDGSGYPQRLSGSQIPLFTRIITIADIFGALVETRGYRLGMKPEKAYAELVVLAEAGKLDARLVHAFGTVAESF